MITLIETGRLKATRVPRGNSFVWRIDEASLQEYLAAHGRYDDRRVAGRSKLARLEADLAVLQGEVRALTSVVAADRRRDLADQPSREQDDLRARVINLEETLARVRVVAELQRDADAQRADVISHLLEAAAANERADSLRRRALYELEEALASFSRPGHAGELT